MRESKAIGYHKMRIKGREAKLPFFKIKSHVENSNFVEIYVAESKGFFWRIVKKSEVEIS